MLQWMPRLHQFRPMRSLPTPSDVSGAARLPATARPLPRMPAIRRSRSSAGLDLEPGLVSPATKVGRSRAVGDDADRRAADPGAVSPPAERVAAAVGERPASSGGVDDAASDAAAPRARRRYQTDLRQDTIEELRVQHRDLRIKAREAQRQVKNAKKRRNRVLTRLRNLDTPSVLAVLMDRMTAPAVEQPADVEAALREAARSGKLPSDLAAALDPLEPPPLPPPADPDRDSDLESDLDDSADPPVRPAGDVERPADPTGDTDEEVPVAGAGEDGQSEA